MPGKRAVGQHLDRQKQFDTVFADHHVAVAHYCVRRLGPVEGEDAAADVFAVAWKRLQDLPPPEQIRAWLLGVAYRVVANHYRSRRRRLRLAHRLAFEPFPVVTRTESVDAQLLRQALGGLGSRDREVLRLWSWDQLTREEMAAILGITENAVDQRLFRARARLRRRMELLQDDPSHPVGDHA
ncbi:MAG TPA: sigma-70 family RNA polymerase sigma factor [Acidimicrobiia bacterium]|nr:sigma-70 family RNA polymerase sigma factor [Acidimicrobiia bacterium]